MTVYQVLLEQVDTVLKDLVEPRETAPTTELPIELEDYSDVFSPKEAEKLPPHRPYDYDIKLIEGQVAPWGPLYLISRDQLLVLKE